MNGLTVTLQGGKMLVNSNTLLQKHSFLPGDQVQMNEVGLWTLVSRPPCIAIGTIKTIANGFACLHLSTFPSTCQTPVYIQACKLKVGDRVLLQLKSNGEFIVLQTFSSYARDDANSIVACYERIIDRRPVLDEPVGPHYYTRHECVDLTHLDTFTIDPADSVDFDDAISVDVDAGIVYIHIVDATQFTSPDSCIRMRERCMSLYLSNERTQHLLTKEDASHTYSLIEGEVRRCITVEVKLLYGSVESYEIYRSKIIVKTRWNYDEINQVLSKSFAPDAFTLLSQLANIRSGDGAYYIQLPSIRLQVNPYGIPTNVQCEDTNDLAHMIVATCMILANLVVSSHLKSRGVVLPNRFHEPIRGIETSAPMIQTGNTIVDSFIRVKKYARALYSVEQSGHFGLNLTDYVHFTSPMRRYADVCIHKLLAGWDISQETLEKEVDYINTRGNLCKTLQELYISWKMLRWIQTKQVLDPVTITDVKQAGVMWFMPTLNMHGFVHVTHLIPSQFWKYEPESQILVGQTNGARISVGIVLQPILQSLQFATGTIQISLVCPNNNK